MIVSSRVVIRLLEANDLYIFASISSLSNVHLLLRWKATPTDLQVFRRGLIIRDSIITIRSWGSSKNAAPSRSSCRNDDVALVKTRYCLTQQVVATPAPAADGSRVAPRTRR